MKMTSLILADGRRSRMKKRISVCEFGNSGEWTMNFILNKIISTINLVIFERSCLPWRRNRRANHGKRWAADAETEHLNKIEKKGKKNT